jgi:hypothetical protein
MVIIIIGRVAKAKVIKNGSNNSVKKFGFWPRPGRPRLQMTDELLFKKAAALIMASGS